MNRIDEDYPVRGGFYPGPPQIDIVEQIDDCDIEEDEEYDPEQDRWGIGSDPNPLSLAPPPERDPSCEGHCHARNRHLVDVMLATQDERDEQLSGDCHAHVSAWVDHRRMDEPPPLGWRLGQYATKREMIEAWRRRREERPADSLSTASKTRFVYRWRGEYVVDAKISLSTSRWLWNRWGIDAAMERLIDLGSIASTARLARARARRMRMRGYRVGVRRLIRLEVEVAE